MPFAPVTERGCRHKGGPPARPRVFRYMNPRWFIDPKDFACGRVKKRILCLMRTILCGLMAVFCLAVAASADEYVSSHYRSNGTYVSGHHRTSPNSTVRDNYSYKGNYNSYTGASGSNYYRSSPSSAYYNGGTSTSTSSNYRYRYSR